MKGYNALVVSFTVFAVARLAGAVEPTASDSPADHLPPDISQLTAFGERADWSSDGKRILFLSKTFGDAMEIDLATRAIRNLTADYSHLGYTRAIYLANGDILLSGPESFDPKHAREARNQCFLYVLDKSLTKPPAPLGVRCNEGPAVSRKRMHIAWTEWNDEPPTGASPRSSKISEADIAYENGAPTLANQRLVLSGSDLPFECELETQNFRPPDERELTFSAYSKQGGGSDVCGIDLATKKVTKYTDSPDEYDEPEASIPTANTRSLNAIGKTAKAPVTSTCGNSSWTAAATTNGSRTSATTPTTKRRIRWSATTAASSPFNWHTQATPQAWDMESLSTTLRKRRRAIISF
jgi:hypothetical protein